MEEILKIANLAIEIFREYTEGKEKEIPGIAQVYTIHRIRTYMNRGRRKRIYRKMSKIAHLAISNITLNNIERAKRYARLYEVLNNKYKQSL